MRRSAVVPAAVLLGLALQVGIHGPAAAEEPTTLTGTVLQTISETVHDRGPATGDVDGERSEVLVTRGGVFPLTADSDVPLGHRVTVEVEPVGAAVRVTDVVAARAAATVAGAADVDRQVYVALVAPRGWSLSQTATLTSVQTGIAAASDYWSSQTGGTIHFSYAATIPAYQSAYYCGDTVSMWNEAVDAFHAAGLEPMGAGKYLMVVAPPGADAHGCDYGLGSLGAPGAAENAVFVSDANQSLFAHELGHNLGLDHANALRCDATQDATWSGTAFPASCRADAYDDLLDVMGYSGVGYGEGNLNAAHLDDLGLTPGAIQTVTGGEVTVPTLASGSPGRGVKVTDDAGVTYYLEYRTPTGRDAVATSNPWTPSTGVLLYREDPDGYGGHGSLQLDATPSAAYYDYARSLRPGATFTSASGTLAVTTVSQAADSAVVRVRVGEPPAPLPTPASVRLWGPSAVRYKGSAVLTVKVLDRTGHGVPAARVVLEYSFGDRWRRLHAVVTSSTGVARITRARLTRTTKFRAAASGATIRSAVERIRVRRGGYHH